MAVILMVVGVWQLRQARTEVLPEFAPPTVEVQTEALGLSALEMEQLITVPLERDFLNGLPFLSTIRSRSVPGLSSVLLVFEPRTSLFTARQLVQERLTLTTELPNVSKPPQMLQAVSSTSRVEMIGLGSTTVSPIDMSVLAQFTIVPRLLGVPGVANISVFGARDLQLQVQVDPARLQKEGVSLDRVISTTGNALFVSPLTFLEASTPGAGGFFDTAGQRLGVQHILPIKSADDLSHVVIDDSPLNLGDVARVVQDHQPLIGDAALADGPGLVLVVQKLPGANTTQVTKAVNAALASLRPGLTGIKVDPNLYQPASFVGTAGRNLGRETAVAAVLALIGLALLLADWRTVLVSAVTVPLSIIAAAYVLYLRGTTMNSMVLAGLVLGLALVMHDAVAVAQTMARRVADRVGDRDDLGPSGPAERDDLGPSGPAERDELGPSAPAERDHRSVGGGAEGDRLDPVDRVASSMRLVARPLTVATLAVGIALVPTLLLAGLPSRPFMPPIAISYALAVGASLLVALTVAPALGALVLRGRSRHGRHHEPPVARLLGRAQAAVVAPALRRPVLAAVAVSLVVLVVGVVSFTQLRTSLQPSFDETDLLIRWQGPPGTALGEMDRIVGRAATELKSVKGVRDIGSHVGRALFGDQIVGSNGAETWVDIDPKADHAKAVAAVQSIVDGYPGMGSQVLSYFNDQVSSIGATSGPPVRIRLYGQDLDVLHAKGTELVGMLKGVKGVRDPQVESAPEQPTIQVSVDLAAAERQGVKPGDVRRAATTLISGLRVGSLYQDQKVFQVVVVGLPDLAKSLTTIQGLPIEVPGGGQIRLGDVAKVEIQPSLSVIRHDNVSRSLDVTAEVSGRGAGAVLADAKHRLTGVSFPAGASAKLLNDAGARGADHLRLLMAGILAAVIIYLILQAELESWSLAAIAVASVPLALTGGVAAAWAAGGTLSLGSLVGLFAVGGLAVRGSTLLLSRFQRLEREGDGPSGPSEREGEGPSGPSEREGEGPSGPSEREGEAPGMPRPEIVRRVALDGCPPFLAGAVVVGLAFAPFVAFGRMPGTEIVHPMAVVVLGGLISCVLATLLVVPAAYVAADQRRATPPAAARPGEDETPPPSPFPEGTADPARVAPDPAAAPAAWHPASTPAQQEASDASS